MIFIVPEPDDKARQQKLSENFWAPMGHQFKIEDRGPPLLSPEPHNPSGDFFFFHPGWVPLLPTHGTSDPFSMHLFSSILAILTFWFGDLDPSLLCGCSVDALSLGGKEIFQKNHRALVVFFFVFCWLF